MKTKLLREIRKRYSFVKVEDSTIHQYLLKDNKTGHITNVLNHEFLVRKLISLGLRKWYKYPYSDKIAVHEKRKEQRKLNFKFKKYE